MFNVYNCDVFFISYDEPDALNRFERIQKKIPNVRHIQGVKGFNAAYQECAKLSRTPRFFSIDGDNELLPEFARLEVDFNQIPDDAVVSWSARNSINGLIYGNGGIKNWPRDVALSMNTHESSLSKPASVDFVFELKYFKMKEVLSVASIHEDAYQAFRSGLREGVKMCTVRGEPPLFNFTGSQEERRKTFFAHISPDNLTRLKIWSSVGSDVQNGLWAMLGARMGCEKLCLTDWDWTLIGNYDWFDQFWSEEICGKIKTDKDVMEKLDALADRLEYELGLHVVTMTKKDSSFFKGVYQSPAHFGLIYQD